MGTFWAIVGLAALVAVVIGALMLAVNVVRRKSLKPWGVTLGSGLALLVASALASTPQPMPAATATPTPTPTRPGVGSPVSSANWEVMVPEAPHRARSLSRGFSTAEALGVFVIIPISVKNIGGQGSTFSQWQLEILDAQGRVHDAAEFTVQQAAGAGDLFLKQINPGLTFDTVVVFDAPADASGLTLKVRGALAATPGLIYLGDTK